ncbi:hypothetical protein Dimus_030906 [Dionaea muscipula]
MGSMRDQQGGGSRKDQQGWGWNPVFYRHYQRKSNGLGFGAVAEHFTVFVDNLPAIVDTKGLVKLFSEFGVIQDAFIPRKKSRSGTRFGFVRYGCPVAADMAIQKGNRVWFQNNKQLLVKMASYARHNEGHKMQDRDVGFNFMMRREKDKGGYRVFSEGKLQMNVGGSKSYRKVLLGSYNKDKDGGSICDNHLGKDAQSNLPIIEGDEYDSDWLRRSIVAEWMSCKKEGSHVETLKAELDQEVKVVRLGRDRVLLTFPSISSLCSALNKEKAWWARWFDSVKQWTKEMTWNYQRQVWLRCCNLPLQAWTINTMISIGQYWGEVLMVDIGDVESGNMEVARDIQLRVGNMFFRCRIVEEQEVVVMSTEEDRGRCCICNHGRNKEDEQMRREEGDDDVASRVMERGDSFNGCRGVSDGEFDKAGWETKKLVESNDLRKGDVKSLGNVEEIKHSNGILGIEGSLSTCGGPPPGFKVAQSPPLKSVVG